MYMAVSLSGTISPACLPGSKYMYNGRPGEDVGGLDNGNRGRKSIPSVFLLAGCWYVCGLWLVGGGEEEGTWVDSNISGLGERGDGSPAKKAVQISMYLFLSLNNVARPQYSVEDTSRSGMALAQVMAPDPHTLEEQPKPNLC